MEYSLLKQIVPNRFYYPSLSSAHPTHYPSFDCVNPGIGNVSSPFSYFVPSHFYSNPNVKQKAIPNNQSNEAIIEQDGKGDETNIEALPSASDQDKKLDTEEEEILNELNQKKRKNLDPAIYKSFLHPKKIKTETLKLEAVGKKVRPTNTTEKLEKSVGKKVVHKFKFE